MKTTSDPPLSLLPLRLPHIRWQTYEALLADLAPERRLRLTYYHGRLDIMVPSPEHERYKKLAGRLVETLAEELELVIEPFGSTTLKQPDALGAELDECFYVTTATRVQDRRRLDLAEDPPPDLVVEIDITNASTHRLPLYAELGIAEVWRYCNSELIIYQLEESCYRAVEQSQVFPNIPSADLSRFLNQVGQRDYLSIVRAFRAWIKQEWR